jgi:hypothetical protein
MNASRRGVASCACKSCAAWKLLTTAKVIKISTRQSSDGCWMVVQQPQRSNRIEQCGRLNSNNNKRRFSVAGCPCRPGIHHHELKNDDDEKIGSSGTNFSCGDHVYMYAIGSTSDFCIFKREQKMRIMFCAVSKGQSATRMEYCFIIVTSGVCDSRDVSSSSASLPNSWRGVSETCFATSTFGSTNETTTWPSRQQTTRQL